MARLTWGATGAKRYYHGCDCGVLYVKDENGAYGQGVAWDGLISVSKSASGGDSNKQWADNEVYANVRGVEECGGSIECFNTPDEFDVCDGTINIGGMKFGQQTRRGFGLAWREKIGNDTDGLDHGEIIYVAYNCTASPADDTAETNNESPEAKTLSYEFEAEKTKFTLNNIEYKAARLEFSSDDLTETKMNAIKDLLWGSASAEPSLPTPEALFAAIA